MFKKSILLATTLLAITLGLCLTTNAQGGQYLGSRNVTDRLDRDRITVSAAHGEIRRLQVRVSRRPVEFLRLVVRYTSGGDDRITFRETIRPGSYSRWLNLSGSRGRRIRSVEFWYNARSFVGGTARVSLYGRR